MRNRGVEIYILNEKECETTNDLDVKSLIKLQGLNDTSYINTLLQLHDFISDLVLWEKPNINNLLNAASLISREIIHGLGDFDAFYDTLMEVYCKTRTPNEFNCNDVATLLKTKIRQLLQLKNNEFYKSATLRIDKLRIWSDFEKIRQQGAHLETILKDELPDLNYLTHFYSNSTCNDLNLRHCYFNLLNKNQNNVMGYISNSLFKFIGDLKSLNEDPLDLRWIPDYNGQYNYFLSNCLVLTLRLITQLKNEEFRTKNTDFTLNQYMISRSLKRIDDHFDDVLIDNFLELITEYDKFIIQILSKVQLSDEQIIKLQELFSWRIVLNNCTRVNVKKINNTQRHIILTNLKIHYHWFCKYALKSLLQVTSQPLNNKLDFIVKKIDSSLKNDYSVISKLAKNYQKNKPNPRTSETQIELASIVYDINKNLDFCDKSRDYREIINIFKANPGLRDLLIESKLDNYDSLEKLVLLKGVSQTDLSSNPQTDLDVYKIALLPILDYFLQLKAKKSVLFGDQITEFKANIIVPVNFATSVLLYCNDDISYKLSKELMDYLTNSINVRLNEDTNEVLPIFSPFLTYHLVNLVLSERNTNLPKLGNLNDVIQQHNFLSMILWNNFQQLHDETYDYLWFEINFVAKLYEKFIIELGQAMNLNENNDIAQLGDLCLQHFYVYTKNNDLAFSLYKHLENCFLNFKNVRKIHDFDMQLLTISMIHMELGYFKIVLNSKLPLIDPSAKKALKKKYCQESINKFEELKRSFEGLNDIFSGNNKSIHAHHTPVCLMIENLKMRNEKLGICVAIRPKNITYEEIFKSVNHAFSTILSWGYIDSLILELKQSVEQIKCGTFKNLKKFQSSLTSFENLYYEWGNYSASYPDIIEPLLSNLSQFLYGFKMNLQLLRRVIRIQEDSGFDLQKELVKLVKFPNLDQENNRYESVIDSYTNNKIQNDIKRHLNQENKASANIEVLRLVFDHVYIFIDLKFLGCLSVVFRKVSIIVW